MSYSDRQTRLPFSALRAHGFSDELIHLWTEAYGDTLLPLQSRAVCETRFLRGDNLIVFAPTSSGKTFVAEMAALRHLENRRRVIYLSPTKALAEEKFRQMRHLYGKQGFRIRVATRERPETDGRVLRGEFDLLIAIYEKMKAYLVTHPELLSQVGLVVMDEVQMLGESGRGGVVDLLLTKMARAPFGAQFMGLSAVLGDAGRIANWLQCELLEFRERPVELREGVLNCATGDFAYRCFNSGEEGVEVLCPEARMDDPTEDDAGADLAAIVGPALALAEGRGEQTLVFAATRAMSRQWAAAAARLSGLPPARAALEELSQAEDSWSRDHLEDCLRVGVAFHNADLSPEMRRLIETHFANGAIRLLFSTSTLAQGVNLTAVNVLQCPSMVTSEQWTGAAGMAPLSLQRFKNQGGRAARYGATAAFGRSILPARNEGEQQRLLRDFLSEDFESVRPPLRDADLEAVVTDLVASKMCRSRDELVDFLTHTYSGLLAWSPHLDEFVIHVDEAVARAMEDAFIRRDGAGRLEASGLGAVMAGAGIASATATRLAQWIRACHDGAFALMEPLVVAAFTPDARAFPVWLTDAEKQAGVYRRDVLDALGRPWEDLTPPLGDLLQPVGGFTPDDLASLKMAVAMMEWIGPRDTREIEERFRMMAGSLAALGAQFNWLAQTLAALGPVYGRPPEIGSRLKELADRLTVGVETAGLPLARLRLPHLGRGAIRALVAEGFESPESLIDMDTAAVESILPPTLAETLLEEIRRRFPAKEPAEEPDADAERDKGAGTPAAPRLVFETAGAGYATLDGEPLELCPIGYTLLRMLARAGAPGVAYTEIAETIWPDYPADRQVIHQHKKRLIKALGNVIGPEAARAMLMTRAGFGFVLCLDPSKIAIR